MAHRLTRDHIDFAVNSGLFDAEYYCGQFDAGSVPAPEVDHFLAHGRHATADPNAYFWTRWYLENNPDVAQSGLPALWHYILIGDPQGRNPSPIFDTTWYKKTYNLNESKNALVHYLAVLKISPFNPNPHFDASHYLAANPDVRRARVDPFFHYFYTGCFEGRRPSREVDLGAYLERWRAREIVHPFLQYIQDLDQRAAKPAARPVPATPAAKAAPRLDAAVQRKLAALVDADFYARMYADVGAGGGDPVDHYLSGGYRENRQPSLYFNPQWYLKTYLGDRDAQTIPAVHYVVEGEALGHQPSLFFNPAWYRQHYGLDEQTSPLQHYLANRRTYKFSPIPQFDIEYYIETNRDVATAGVDAFEHFLLFGYKEGRNPAEDFQIKYYAGKYLSGDLSENPFIHYLQHYGDGIHHGIPGPDETTLARELKAFTRKSRDFELVGDVARGKPVQAMILAYYLPQFHAFPENDRWWGDGFTEWTNIPRGIPRFQGHYQPRIPRDLGYYSLDDNTTVRRQVDLAKGAGVHGFVYYYYWFNGKRLMEKPLENLLADPSIDMPFCLMWANESWTRRWDGAENEVLISQDYDSADDEALAADLARHFADPRYIRLDGRPLLMLYRIGIIPDARATLARLRQLFRSAHGEDPIIIMAQAFNDNDPRPFGLDGAIEFPPHKLTAHLPSVHLELNYIDNEFAGRVYRYDDVMQVSLADTHDDFPLIKTAVPGWDNDARRQGTGLALIDSTPRKYQAWLNALIRHARAHPFFGTPIVCINAWNEWCEAAYLEPDIHYGAAYLNATGRAAIGISADPGTYPLVLVGHDAFPSGAQHLLLNLGRRLAAVHGVTIEFVLLGDGKLVDDYRAVAPTQVIDAAVGAEAALAALAARGFRHAIVNTLVSAAIIPALTKQGMTCVNLVHELPSIIKSRGLETRARHALDQAGALVFAAGYVRDRLYDLLGRTPGAEAQILPQGCYRTITRDRAAGAAMRKQLGIARDHRVMIGVGYADLRKGFDLFLQVWRALSHLSARPVHAIWAGGIDGDLAGWLQTEIDQAEASGQFHMLGYRDDIDRLLNAADVYALTSREDPFPTVVHEALSAGIPAFAFADAGGMSEYIADHALGAVVPHGDALAMAQAIDDWLTTHDAAAAAERLTTFVREQLDFDAYTANLLQLAVPQCPQVSVVVPSYNYARYADARLGTIFAQTLPVREVLVLDDASTDDSPAAYAATAQTWGRAINLVVNRKNSGSVFAQWHKAIELAQGEFLWIAEADDEADPVFLERLAHALQQDPHIAFAFCDSRSIDEAGEPVWPSYREYYASFGPGTLTQDEVFEGADFVRRYLAVKNIILNVSGVLWRRSALQAALASCKKELREYRLAGDWRLYLAALAMPGAKVGYLADTLNVHRRHRSSVTRILSAEDHLSEITKCHSAANALVNADGEGLARQQAYLAELTVQMGLSDRRA